MTTANLDLVTNDAAREAIRTVLQTHVMFSVLPRAQKRLIEPLLEVRRYEPGDVVEAQDEPIAGMHVVHAGSARLKRESDGKLISTGTLGPGDTVGEMSMLEEAEWAYSVVAEEITTTIFLPALPMQDLLRRDPVIDEHFKRFVGLVKVGERLRGLLGATTYSPADFTAMLGELGVKRIRDGAALFNQGDADPRLYFIESGTAELIRQPLEGEALSLGRFGRGTLIGEGGALPRGANTGVQPHTARAVGELTVLVIYQGTVRKLLEYNPLLGDQLRRRVRELEQFEQDELAIRKRAEGVDLRIQLADSLTEEEFRALFEAAAKKMGFEYQAGPVEYVMETHFRKVRRPMRFCHPRDLLLQIRNYCTYHGRPLELRDEYFDIACENYFAVTAVSQPAG